MATTNETLRDLGISHAIGVRRLSTGLSKKVVSLLNTVDADLLAQIRRLDPDSPSRRRVDQMLIALRTVNKDVYRQAASELRSELTSLAAYEAGYQVNSMAQVGFEEMQLPTQSLLVAAVVSEPFQGRYLKEWTDGLEVGRYNRLRDAVRIGVVAGEGIDTIVQRVRGTKSLRYKDGVLDISRRSATTMVRTAVSHVVEAAKHAVYGENEDILDGWRWVATLDTSTCLTCAELDGQVFPVGEGPAIPEHLNCRCISTPVVKGGGAASRITYNGWLNSQPAATQDMALGPTRGKLFRDGGLSIDRFTDDLGRPLTLDQLQQVEE